LPRGRRAPDRFDATAQEFDHGEVDSDSARIAGSVVRRVQCPDAIACLAAKARSPR